MIGAFLLHILPGLMVLAAAALVTFRWGGRLEKQVMGVVLVIWLLSTIVQVLWRGRIEPLIAGDVVFAAWLLWLVVRIERRWLYVLFAVEGARLVVHAMMHHAGASPSLTYRLANNLLSLAALAVIAVAAVLHARVVKAEAPQPS